MWAFRWVVPGATALVVHGAMNWTRYDGMWQMDLDWALQGVVNKYDIVISSPLWTDVVLVPAIINLLLFLPVLLCGIVVHHFVRRGSYCDGHCRCRKCANILRRLAEPRCPECGESI